MLDSIDPIVMPTAFRTGQGIPDIAHPPARARASPFECWFGEGERVHWSAPVAAPVACRVARQTALLREGACARNVYVVQAGDFKVSRMAEDGYEQVLDFSAAGEVLGLEGLAGGRTLATVEALQDSLVYAIPIHDLRALRAASPLFDERLQESLSAQWSRMRDLAWLTGAVGSDRRTARFLLLMARRMAERGMSACRLHLTMRRRDIASYLGLAHESISRSMTALASAGFLKVLGREVEIIDMEGLRLLASNTRGHGGEGGPATVAAPRSPRRSTIESYAH
jgi:CRP/FNR family transcriptional regulator